MRFLKAAEKQPEAIREQLVRQFTHSPIGAVSGAVDCLGRSRKDPHTHPNL